MIAIKTMNKLPEECEKCPCYATYDGHCQADDILRTSIYRPFWCPLTLVEEKKENKNILLDKIISALENCTAEEKCRDCPWEECEHEHKTVKLPLGLVLDILSILHFKAFIASAVNSDDKL